jgi:CheY-like chemotaxis protein
MNKILTKSNASNLVIWPLCLFDPKWSSEEVPKAHKYGIALLSLTYFCQLFMFKYKDNFNIGGEGREDVEFYAKISLFIGTLVGAIIAYCILSFFRKKGNEKSIHWIIFLTNLFLTIYFCLYINAFDAIKVKDNWIYTFYFLIGFFNASCIGLSITWIIENLFKHLRTTGTIYFGLVGFLGALIASGIEPNKYHISIYIILVISLIFHLGILLRSKKILADSKLVTIFFERERKRKSLRSEIEDNYKEIFFSLLLGMIVQYWTFWASKSQKLFFTASTETDFNASFYRYLGVAIGSIFLIILFNKSRIRRRNKILLVALRGSFILNVILIFNHAKSFIEIDKNCLIVLSLIIGILSSIWVFSILHTAEQFNLRLRPLMIILAPNIYRASEMILLWRTHNPSDKMDFTAVHSWGVMFAFLGIAAVYVLKNDKFEADALDTAVDKEGKINNAKILGKIHTVQEKEQGAFFEDANNIICSYVEDDVQMKFYLSAIYYKPSNSNKIAHSNYKKQEEVLACYSNMPPEKVENAHVLSTKLVDKGTHDSYINFLFAETKFYGGLMFRSGRTGRKTLKEDFKQFELDVIDLSEYMPDTKSLKETREVLESGKHESLSNINFQVTVKSDISDQLKQTFGLFATDASYYNPEAYFLYLIKPISANTPRSMLVIKTSDELSEDNLRRLQHLISTVQGKWDEINGTTQSELNYENLLRLLSKSLSTHAIRNTFLKLKECVTSESRSDEDKLNTIDNLSMLLTSNMASESKILIGKELKFLKSYMFYYLNNKRSDAPAEIQEKIDSAVRNKILPFNWKIDFPVELKNVYMPKAIIQPMVENAFKYSGYKMNELNELGLKVEFKRIANEVEEDTADIEICVSNSIKPETKINLEEVKQKILFGKPNALAHNSLHLIWQRLNYEIKNKSSEDGVLIIPEVRGNKFLLTCKIIGCRFEKRAEHRPTMNLAQKKVLLIEDNAEDVFKTKEIITGEGNRTLKGDIKIERVVNTLNEARDVLKGKHPFNIVIVDLMLSKDGEEDYWTTQIFEELSQENIELAEIGIIFLSGESSKESDVSIFMTKRFPKNYLGFSTKFEDTYDDLDNFLNIYYERFKK